MYKKLSLIIFLQSIIRLTGQDIAADSMYHYLILQSKGNNKHSIVFRENKKIEVTDTTGEFFKGKVFILNDSTIEIVNYHSSEIDTVLISKITKIRYVGLANKIIAYQSLLLAGGFIWYGWEVYSAAGKIDPIGSAIGTAIMVISTPFIAFSAVLFHGKTFKTSNYDIVIHHTKTKKLKRKQSKHFYPKT